MASEKLTNIYLYTRYERFWHWLQMVLIFLLLASPGWKFTIFTHMFGFDLAVEIHSFVGLTWLIAFAFFRVLDIYDW